MDLVSFETQQEYDWVKGFIDGKRRFYDHQSKSTKYSQEVSLTSGHLGENAILEVATSLSFSPS